MSRTVVAAGGRLRDRVGVRAPAAVFAALGLALLAAGFAVPAFQRLLFAWGGTGLFVALLLRLVLTGATVPAGVATDVHAAMAGNARRLAPDGPRRYVPEEDGVTLTVGGHGFDPVGSRLLADVETADSATEADWLAVLVDVAVSDLELAGRVTARPTEAGATITVTDSRVGTEELFDHPLVSLFGVGLAAHLGTPVTVDAAVQPTFNGDRLVVHCEWSESTDELLDGP